MAKKILKFNNIEYEIDDAILGPAITNLQSHMSTCMNGSGATINFNGIDYNIDSTKLFSARDLFINHLRAIAGKGREVKIGNIQYEVDSSKLSNAFSKLESTISNLVPEKPINLDPGLYDDNNNLIVSWEDLEEVYGLKANKTYGASSYSNDTASPYYVLSNNPELAKGTKLSIGDTISSISSYAFNNCDMLTYIRIPDTVTYIGNYSFNNCINLNDVNIPENIATLYNYAFYNCTGLEKIYFNAINMNALNSENNVFSNAGKNGHGIKVIVGKNVTKIPSHLFYPGAGSSQQPKVVDLEFEEGSVCTSIGGYAFRDKGIGYVKLPDSITDIYAYAFYQCNNLITQLPPSLVNIYTYAFYSCRSLTDIIFPASVTKIYKGAFGNCSNITNVYISDIEAWCNVEFGDASANPLSAAANLYINNSIVKHLVIPEGITSINAYAFSSYAHLTSITLPSTLTAIGTSAFNNCYKLIEVINNSSLTIEAGSSDYGNVAAYAKDVHTSTSKIINQDGYLFYTYNDINYLLGYNGESKDLILPESYNSENYQIYKYAFFRTDIKGITIPKNVTTIGNSAFYNCTALETVYFDAAALTDLSAKNYVFYCAGQSGNGLKLIVGKNVTKIPSYLFYPYDISEYTPNYSYVPKLISIQFEEGSICKSIGSYAFNYCRRLRGIEIPDTVTSIGSYSFGSCKNCISITIGANVTSINSNAFYFCPKVVEVINKSKLSISKNSTSNGYVAKYAMEVHKGSTKINNINDYLFYTYGGVNYLLCYIGNDKELILPKNYNNESYEIYDRAFYINSEITSMTIPDSVTEIGYESFDDCSNLATIIYNGTVEQWNSIPGRSYLDVPATYVQCSDGQVAI